MMSGKCWIAEVTYKRQHFVDMAAWRTRRLQDLLDYEEVSLMACILPYLVW